MKIKSEFIKEIEQRLKNIKPFTVEGHEVKNDILPNKSR